MSVRIRDVVYVLDKDDLAMVGAVLVRLLAEGQTNDRNPTCRRLLPGPT